MATENCSSSYTSTASNVGLRSHQIPSDVSPMTNLQDDLLAEILIRLPNPRNASRCKSVCKRWASLISSHHFNRRFVSHHRSRYQPLLFSSQDSQSVIRSFLPAMPDEEVGERFFVCDSFEDLVLCGFPHSILFNGELARTYIVCNPFTKQWVALPVASEAPDIASIVKLVVKPCISNDLDLGEGQVFAYSSKFRFRVVIMYIYKYSCRLDVFCSESGEWRKDAAVVKGIFGPFEYKVAYYNGALFFTKKLDAMGRNLLLSLDPFRLDMPPTPYVDASSILDESKRGWKLMISQGALHLLTLEHETPGYVTVWRLEEGCKSWRKQYEWLGSTASIMGDFELKRFCLAYLHPDKPEIVFLEYWDPHKEKSGVYSCDLSRMAGGEELDFFEGFRPGAPCWRILQAKVHDWPSPIPRYEELRGTYNGSYNCWVQSCEATTLSVFEECHSVDD